MSETDLTTETGPTDSASVLWATRLLRHALFDADGSTIGSVEDMVMLSESAGRRPRLQGFVALVDRRQIFVHVARVDAVDRDGVHLLGGTVDLRRFRRRPGEILVAGDVIGTSSQRGPVTDVGFIERVEEEGVWEVHQIATSVGSRLRRRSLDVSGWDTVAASFQPDRVAGDLAALRDLHKADAAQAIQSLPDDRRAELTAALEASRLADVLEELPEQEQAEILDQLEPDAAVAVLDEMEIDDEIDLLKELRPAQREALLAQMPDEEVTRLRALLSHREDTAGGMMTPEPVVVEPTATVAEAIARLRDADLPPALSARLFITEVPIVPPTGNFLGSVTLPRLLREPPTRAVGELIGSDEATLQPSSHESEVAHLLARYDLLAVAVVDAAERLVGVVTVDDVLLRLLQRDRP
jgi:CBS domain-containing protein